MRLIFFILLFPSIVFCQVPVSGTIKNVILGQTMSNETWVYVSSIDGKAYKADGSDKSKYAYGLIHIGGSSGDTTQIFLNGLNPWTLGGLNATNIYYLSDATPGSMTNTKPTQYGFSQALCVATQDSAIIINPHPVDDNKVQKTVKTSDESRTSSTTLTADATLTATLAAGAKYSVKIVAFVETANATMDYKWDVNFSGTTSAVIGENYYTDAGGTSERPTMAKSLPTSTSVAAATSGIGHVKCEYYIYTTIGGTLSFRWAQNTSDAGAIKVLSGSYIEVTIL